MWRLFNQRWRALSLLCGRSFFCRHRGKPVRPAPNTAIAVAVAAAAEWPRTSVGKPSPYVAGRRVWLRAPYLGARLSRRRFTGRSRLRRRRLNRGCLAHFGSIAKKSTQLIGGSIIKALSLLEVEISYHLVNCRNDFLVGNRLVAILPKGCRGVQTAMEAGTSNGNGHGRFVGPGTERARGTRHCRSPRGFRNYMHIGCGVHVPSFSGQGLTAVSKRDPHNTAAFSLSTDKNHCRTPYNPLQLLSRLPLPCSKRPHPTPLSLTPQHQEAHG